MAKRKQGVDYGKLRTDNEIAIDKHVGMQIRRLRLLKDKMSQTKLGDVLGITFQQVQKYESGTNRIGASRLWNMAQVLGVPVSAFFDGLDGKETIDDGLFDVIDSRRSIELVRAFNNIKSKDVQNHIYELVRLVSK